ncbi:LacI family DNA-binding transcriptional regulator [Pararoseomonas indoligenes]|uniref:LacI family DNA-binding transcriptional regulator n=1 Tax=Roseomonas indoligenes TaxID=2820811 RepID=A0A940N223_9PROT|nr:LacI family DNA-binding transcriptional regulator [Pararoseomonas indoligenes]MBP0495332.1 LacI family DNA-binding transcriptional regulator [Pararoseomonas indoligenes]
MQTQVTLRDVARAAKVSVSTASRALAGGGLTSKSTEARLQRIATELGYRPNTLARGLKTRTTRLVGLVVHNLTNASFRVLAEVVQRRLRAEGYQALLCITADDPEQEAVTIETLTDQRVDGLIICPTGRNGALLAVLEANGTPVTCVVRRDETVELETVLAADPEGAFAGTRHLLELGHRRIGLIVGRQETTSGRERLSGYRRALEEAGIPFDASLVHAGRYEPETGLAGCRQLLDRDDRPSALFAANHESSLGVLRGLAERNIVVPDDISLLCYEDVPGFAWQRPAISVVDSGANAMAELAADRLLQRLRPGAAPPAATAREYRIGARLIQRQSCRPVAP